MPASEYIMYHRFRLAFFRVRTSTCRGYCNLSAAPAAFHTVFCVEYVVVIICPIAIA